MGAWTAGLPGPTPGYRRSGQDPCGGEGHIRCQILRPEWQPRARPTTAELPDQRADAQAARRAQIPAIRLGRTTYFVP
jgi:hypothetical protein